MRFLHGSIPGIVVLCCLPAAAYAQGAVSLREAVERAVARYPAVRASESELAAAGAGVDLARTAYLPRTDLILLANRATRNNVFGMLLPQSVIPAISGPVLNDATWSSTFGSAAGALFSWEPFDFGQRKAGVDVASAIRAQADSRLALTRFQVGAAAADAFLRLLAAQEGVRAAQANLERSQVFADSVAALTKAELRPGADHSRAVAELARSRTELIRAEQAVEVGRALLAEWMGVSGKDLEIRPGRLLDLPAAPAPAPPLSAHPLAAVQSAATAISQARQRALERAFFPRFQVQSSLYGRGSGARTDGRFLGGANGLAMSTTNWAAGMSVTFPIFEFASLRARKSIEAHQERAEAARYDQRLQELNGQQERARALLDGARRVAENTPVQLQAARTLDQQARARYQAGLATVVEVAEAQRLLTQAEIEDALARLAVWQALFVQALAEGDLTRLLQAAEK